MRISAILATLNRHEYMKGCLSSLKEQLCQNFEIIVIDQSDNTLTKELCESDAFAQLPISYYHVDFRGLSKARNFGIARATGDFIWLVDDDAVYEKDYIECAKNFLEKHPGSALCGKIFDYDYRTHNSLNYVGLTSGQKMTVNDIFRVAPSPALIMPMEPVRNITGFDERFGVGAQYGSGEETDVLLQIMQKGVEVYFLPEMILYHGMKQPPLTSTAYEKVYSYYVGNGALLKKHFVFLKNKAVIQKLLRLTVGAYIKWATGDSQTKKLYDKRIRGFHKGFRDFKNV